MSVKPSMLLQSFVVLIVETDVKSISVPFLSLPEAMTAGYGLKKIGNRVTVIDSVGRQHDCGTTP